MAVWPFLLFKIQSVVIRQYVKFQNKQKMITELRLGNYLDVSVTSSKTGETVVTRCQVTGIIDQDNILVIDGIIANKKYLRGIPITDEWLLKAGFEDKGLNVYRLEDDMLQLWNINNHYYRGYYKGSSGIVADLVYVHQLQNLYFALTGKELTLAEPINP